MKIGHVIGKITLHPKVCAYEGGRFLVVHPLSREQLSGASLDKLTKGSSLIVYDSLGAREGDIIGYSESGEAAAAFEDSDSGRRLQHRHS